MKSLSSRERLLVFVVLPVAAILLAIGYVVLLNRPEEKPAHSHSHSHHPHTHTHSAE
ncbi:MAG: hypothetical protein AAF733_11390 [Verrucomicrobiota bacterium]